MMPGMTNATAPTPDDERLLFGPTDGWRLAPVAAWLLTEGRRLGEPDQLIAGLVAELRRAGAPVDRLQAGVRTLHPQVSAWVVVSADGRTELQRRGFYSDHYAGSPMEWVHQHARPF